MRPGGVTATTSRPSCSARAAAKQRFVAGQLARLADGEHFARPGLVFAEYVHPDCRQALLYRVGGAVRGIADEYLGLRGASCNDDDSLGPCGGKYG